MPRYFIRQGYGRTATFLYQFPNTDPELIDPDTLDDNDHLVVTASRSRADGLAWEFDASVVEWDDD